LLPRITAPLVSLTPVCSPADQYLFPPENSSRGATIPILGSARLRRIKELIHAKMEDDLSLNEMAQSVGLSTAHFARMFRKSTGETPHQFVLRQRLERAKAMLRAPDARVLDVAVVCGFKTQQHFAQVFRDFWGVSPTEYRQVLVKFSKIPTIPAEIRTNPFPICSLITERFRDVEHVTLTRAFLNNPQSFLRRLWP
jgi:AraC-like DNA-binding protein